MRLGDLDALKEEISSWGMNDYEPADFIDAIDATPTVEPEKVLVANVTFDEDKLKEIVQTEVIEKIKSGELVLKTEERPQGKWVTTSHKTDLGTFEVNNKICSQCKHSTKYEYPFCPWCGADMREGGAE